MITVYIWGRLDPTGHVSIGTENDYFSFHPSDRDWMEDARGTPAFLGSWEDDVAAHGRPEAIRINCLSEELANREIAAFRQDERNQRLTYKLFSTNCSSTTASILLAAAEQRIDTHKTMNQLLLSLKRTPMHHDHGRATELLLEWTEDFTVMCARGRRLGKLGKFLGPLLLVDLAIREFVWSPGNVKALARDFASHNY